MVMNGPVLFVVKRASCMAVLVTLCCPVGAVAEEFTRTYDLSGFDGVSASQGIQLIVETGEAYAVVAQSDELSQLELLEIDVRRSVLRAEMDQGLFSSRSVEGWRVTVFVSMPELTQAFTSSGANIIADKIVGDALELSASGGSQITVASIVGDRISMTSENGSRITVDGGSCQAQDLAASDGSSVAAEGLRCSSVDVSASGGSSIAAFAEQSIEANASSGAIVQVFGEPEERDLDASSGGSISFP